MTYFAAVLSGNVIVAIDKELPIQDMISLLQRCGAKALVYSSSFEDVAQAARASGAVKTAFSIAEFPAIVKSRSDPAPTSTDESAACAIIYTSGTTGDSKGGMLPQKNTLRNAASMST